VIQAGFVRLVVVREFDFEDAPDLSMNKIPFGIERGSDAFHAVAKSLAAAASVEYYS